MKEQIKPKEIIKPTATETELNPLIKKELIKQIKKLDKIINKDKTAKEFDEQFKKLEQDLKQQEDNRNIFK